LGASLRLAEFVATLALAQDNAFGHKIGVSTRAAAALWAMQHGVVA
jgi:hypothetical protein